jgi:sulfatase maturation enzyme AslB (radical SAM superfamily)
MVNAPQFETLRQMDSSPWLDLTKSIMDQEQWPIECVRCKDAEQVGNKSIRQHYLNDHESNLAKVKNYLVLGGVLDNICNSACQTCNENLSTKIGSLTSKDYIKIDNSSKLDQLPLDRIVKIDINGGEPSASPNYLKLLQNLPPNVTHIRLNTNGSRVLTSLNQLIDRGVKVTVTVSLDGIGAVHDYIRWPIKWSDVERNLNAYKEMNLYELNTWSTVSSLNIGNLKQIQSYVKQHNIQHSYALLEQPSVLSVKYSNHFTRTADVPDELVNLVAIKENNDQELQMFIKQQDSLRNIDIGNFYSKC